MKLTLDYLTDIRHHGKTPLQKNNLRLESSQLNDSINENCLEIFDEPLFLATYDEVM